MLREQKTFRVVQIAFVVFALLVFPQMKFLAPPQPAGPITLFHKVIVFISIVDNVIGVVLQRIMLRGNGRSLLTRSGASPAQRWLVANVVRLAIALSTCMFGLVLHMTGAPTWLSRALVGLGIVFMVVVSPGKPPEEPAQNAS